MKEEFIVAETKIMSAGAVKSMVAALAAEFECETGHKLNVNFGTAGSVFYPNSPANNGAREIEFRLNLLF